MSTGESNIWRTFALVLIGITLGFLLGRFNFTSFNFENEPKDLTESITSKLETDSVKESESVPIAEVDDDPFLGAEDAEVTVIEFSDYQCPFCKQLNDEILPLFKKDYVETGKAKLVFRDFPLDIHKNAVTAAMAANCAGNQGKYWEMHDLLFEKQSQWSKSEEINTALTEIAKELNIRINTFVECLNNEEGLNEITKDKLDGISYGIKGTPTLFINGEILRGLPRNYEDFKSTIEEKL